MVDEAWEKLLRNTQNVNFFCSPRYIKDIKENGRLPGFSLFSGSHVKIQNGVYDMATNGINAQLRTTNGGQRRFGWLLSGIALRILIAFIMSWMIILAFFVSGVISH